jgi:hypothetical protein
MSTVIEQSSTAELAIIEAFEITKQQIAEAVELANEATVIDHEDTEGMKLCHDYRMGLVKMRTGIDKKHKDLKADVLKRGRLIDSIAKELKEPLPAAEARLKELEDTAKREAERLEAIAKEAREKELRRRCELANSVAWSIPIAMLATLTNEEFETAYSEKLAEKEAREKAAAELAEAQRKEQERQEAIAKEQAAKAAELARQQAEIDAKLRAIEDAEREKRERCLGWRTMCLARVNAHMDQSAMMALTDEEFESRMVILRHNFDVEVEQRKADEAAAERARHEQAAKDLAERIEREAAAKAERIEQERLAEIARVEAHTKAEAEKAARKAARAPDREKIAAYEKVIEAIPLPKLSKAAKRHEDRVHQACCDFVNTLDDIRNELE